MDYLMIFLSVIVLIAAVGGLVMYRSMFVATKGEKIVTYSAPRKALLVLDLQEGYDGKNPRQPATPPAAGSMFSTVNRLIDIAANNGMEVLYIRQVFSSNFFVRLHGGRQVGRVIVDRRITKINDNDFEKNRTDAFSNRNLEQYLIDHQVDELYLTGVDAAYCVYYTALGGLNRGYRVHVVSDAVTSRVSMSEVIQRYRRKGIGILTGDQLYRKLVPT